MWSRWPAELQIYVECRGKVIWMNLKGAWLLMLDWHILPCFAVCLVFCLTAHAVLYLSRSLLFHPALLCSTPLHTCSPFSLRVFKPPLPRAPLPEYYSLWIPTHSCFPQDRWLVLCRWIFPSWWVTVSDVTLAVRSDFGVNNIKSWIHSALHQLLIKPLHSNIHPSHQISVQ